MLQSVRDYLEADGAGRVHVQRFIKNSGGTGDGQWQDWSFASGQPAYDARIGNALVFTPAVAVRNDAIYFPPAPGMERRITDIDITTRAGGVSQVGVEFQIYDLVGYYPLIDGDSTDVQAMDNTAELPRYQGGAGVQAVLVNHVAPGLAASDMLVNYTDSEGNDRAVTWRAIAYGAGKVGYTTAVNGSSGPLYASLAQGSTGVRRINDVQFASAPGGLWCIYLVKPLGSIANRAGSNAATAVKEFLKDGVPPLVPDGAWLGFFYMTTGANRNVQINGNVKMMWG